MTLTEAPLSSVCHSQKAEAGTESRQQIIFSHLTPTFLGGFSSIISFKEISSLALISDRYSANVQTTGRADFPGRNLSTKSVIAQRIRAQWVVGSSSSTVV